MFGILIAMFSNKYLKACVFIVILQLVFLFINKIVDYLPIEYVKRQLSKDYMSEQEEKQMIIDQQNKIDDYKRFKNKTPNEKLRSENILEEQTIKRQVTV